jgi:hypothetical protein
MRMIKPSKIEEIASSLLRIPSDNLRIFLKIMRRG